MLLLKMYKPINENYIHFRGKSTHSKHCKHSYFLDEIFCESDVGIPSRDSYNIVRDTKITLCCVCYSRYLDRCHNSLICFKIPPTSET